MASPEILDFEKLLAPLSGDNLAGVNLRDGFSPTSVYQTIKTARAKARAAERKLAEGDTAQVADWSPVLELVPQVLAGKSKDLELAAWLTEALLREHGFPGLRDGFRLARLLVERYWDRLYPLPDEEGVGIRVAALGALNGLDGAEGTLIVPINKVPLTEEGAPQGPFAQWHFRQAAAVEGLSDPERRDRRIKEGAVTREMIERAEVGTSAQFCQKIREDLSQCLEEFDQLSALLEQKCGKDPAGQPLAPPSSMIRAGLKECRGIVEAMALNKRVDGKGAQATPGQPGRSSGDGRGSVLASEGRMKNREEAFQTLLRVAQFFKETEPHSPVSYALERAARWGKMPLPELLAELIAEEGARTSVFKLVGIQEGKQGGQ